MPDPEDMREVLRKVRQVEIRTRRLVTDAMAGAYHSSFKGRGMDFEDVREYAPGDDVRTIDWNVTAKMDRPYVKRFREERELTLMLVVDLSASGRYGSGNLSKRELAAEVASVLAFSAVRNNDKVGLILFTDQIEQLIPPKKGRAHVLRVIREMLFYKPKHRGTNIGLALDVMNRVLKRRALCFVVSDFLEPKGDDDALLHALSLSGRRHDLVCVRLQDPHELSLPNVGVVALEDAETGAVVDVDTSRSSVRLNYEAANRKRVDQWMRSVGQRGLDCVNVSTDKPYITALKRFFEQRASRR